MFPNNIRIMIADDSKIMRLFTKKILKELGYTNVEDFTDGLNAWQALEASVNDPQKSFQLIISDWTMPNMSGLELFEQTRKHEQLKALPFILLTAEADVNLIKNAMDAGVSHYINKPYTSDIMKSGLELAYLRTNKKAAA